MTDFCIDSVYNNQRLKRDQKALKFSPSEQKTNDTWHQSENQRLTYKLADRLYYNFEMLFLFGLSKAGERKR